MTGGIHDFLAAIDRHRLFAALSVAIIVRVLLFVLSPLHPITDEHGKLVSPVHYAGTDLGYYESYRNGFYFPEGGEAQRQVFLKGEHYATDTMAAPPLFPALRMTPCDFMCDFWLTG